MFQRLCSEYLLALLISSTAPLALAQDVQRDKRLPSVEVANVRRIFHDGQHNAFTDMCRFQGQLYLAFRSCPDGHMVHPTSSIIILTSSDGRHGEGKAAQLLQSKPPYTHWDRKSLDRPIGGPLLTKWDGHIVVGGRKNTDQGPRTALYWLDQQDSLVEFTELPSAGDNSYPGFIELSPGRAIVSYYSSHEKDSSGKAFTAIYLAELQLK